MAVDQNGRPHPRAGAVAKVDGGMDVADDFDEARIDLHPAVSLGDGAGLRLKVPALVHGPRRLILPSFSEWSAGAPWNGEVAEDEKLWLISPRRIWAMRR